MKIKINKIIKFLLLSDILFYTGWGLINPLFALYILEKIQGADPFVIGMATAIYWIAFSLLRVPFGLFLDHVEGERDDYWFMVVGLFLSALVPFGFIFASAIWHIYALQLIHGFGIALSVAGWSAIFYRHIDKDLESTEFGISSSSIAITTALSALVGGWAIQKWGFVAVFAAVGLLGLLGALALLSINKEFKGHFELKRYLKQLSFAEVWNKFFEKSSLVKVNKEGDSK